MSDKTKRDEAIQRALERAAFQHAREKDKRGDNGITDRTDFMLDQKNERKN